MKEGEGEMEWGGGRERYVGHWKNGNLHGLGTYTWQGASLNHAQVCELCCSHVHVHMNKLRGRGREGGR